MNEEPHMTLLRHIAEVWAKVETFYATDDLVSMLVEASVVVEMVDSRGFTAYGRPDGCDDSHRRANHKYAVVRPANRAGCAPSVSSRARPPRSR